MRYLKRFNESQTFPTDHEQIHQICEALEIKNYTIDKDGFVNTDFVELTNHSFQKLPIKFGTVFNFIINNCPNLLNLEGSPHTVCGFSCLVSGITSLEGCPKTFRRSGGSLTNFYLSRCRRLKSLVGCPDQVDIFQVANSPITSLEGSPRYPTRGFSVCGCDITDLSGGPEELDGMYRIEECPLTSLKGAPRRVGNGFQVTCKRWNRSGTAPIKYSWSERGVTNIIDAKGIRDIQIQKGTLNLDGTPLEIILKLFDGYRTSYEGSYFGQFFLESLDYNYIRGTHDSPQINLFRFKEALEEFDIDFLDICQTELVNYFLKETLSDEDLENPKIITAGERIAKEYPNSVEFLLKFGDYIFVDDSGRRVDFFGHPL